MEVCPYSYLWWHGYFQVPWRTFVTANVFSVSHQNYFKDWCLITHSLLLCSWPIFNSMNYDHITNQGFNFLRRSFSNRNNLRVPIQFKRKIQPQHLERLFSSRTIVSLFTSIAPVLLNWSNEARCVFPVLKWTSHFMSHSTVSHRSNSSLEANSSCYDRSDMWLYLE